MTYSVILAILFRVAYSIVRNFPSGNNFSVLCLNEQLFLNIRGVCYSVVRNFSSADNFSVLWLTNSCFLRRGVNSLGKMDSVSKYDTDKMFKDDIVRRMSKAPASDLVLKEHDLSNKSQRSLDDGKPKDFVEKLRLLCSSRGSTGMLDLVRTFRKMDYEGYNALTVEEFIKGLRDTGLKCTHEEGEEIFKRFDLDDSGIINMTEFLAALRPPMSQSRLNTIEKAFEKLDRTGAGIVTVEDIKRVYSVKDNPAYTNGDFTKHQILTMFLANFNNGEFDDGKVTKEEFVDYYSGVSASIDNDTYFDLMMRQLYNL